MDPEKQQLDSLAAHVHQALRKLKIGDTGTISCGRAYPVEETKQYVLAYAYHKRKWFEVHHDKVSEILYAKRVEPPPLARYVEDDDPDEL